MVNNLTHSEITKIGNTFIYLCERIPDLSKTKALKLLYFIEEYSVLKYNIPFLGLDYEVWQAGPVAKEVFVDLSNDEQILLGKYVKVKCFDDKRYVEALLPFSDDEFSDNDIDVLEYVYSAYGDKTARELVCKSHEEHTPWYRVAKENGLLEAFNNYTKTSSDCKIDLKVLLDECGKKRYSVSEEMINMNKYLKA